MKTLEKKVDVSLKDKTITLTHNKRCLIIDVAIFYYSIKEMKYKKHKDNFKNLHAALEWLCYKTDV